MLKTKQEIQELLQIRAVDLINRPTKRREGGNVARLNYISDTMLNLIQFDKLNIELDKQGLIELGHLLENFTKSFLSVKNRKNVKSSHTYGGDFTINKTLFEIKSVAINKATEISKAEQNKPLIVIIVDNNRISGNNFQVSHKFYCVRRGTFKGGDRITKSKVLNAVEADQAYEFIDRDELNSIMEWANL